jgi:Protein kinase domain
VPDRDSDLFDELVQSIADGEPIDWDELKRLSADGEMRQLLPQLRLLADIANLHRSAVDEVGGDDDPSKIETVPSPGLRGKPPLRDSSKPDGSGTIGRWGQLQLLRKIGEGAFGEVYHAHDLWLDHPVALKLLKPGIAKRSSASRILHEARKLARVRHPNVVTGQTSTTEESDFGWISSTARRSPPLWDRVD